MLDSKDVESERDIRKRSGGYIKVAMTGDLRLLGGLKF